MTLLLAIIIIECYAAFVYMYTRARELLCLRVSLDRKCTRLRQALAESGAILRCHGAIKICLLQVLAAAEVLFKLNWLHDKSRL